MAEEPISIMVWLAGRSYRIRIKPEEEEATRKAVKVAEDKIMEMKAHYAGKDDQDFIAMTLLTYAADITGEAINMPVLRDELNQMINKVDAVID